MHPLERTVLYVALTLLAVVSLTAILARSGRAAHGTPPESPYARQHSIAFVDVIKAVSPLLGAEDFKEQRREVEEAINEIDRQMQERAREIQQKDPMDPAEVRAFEAEMRSWGIERRRRVDSLASEQVELAYRDVVAAVEVVAERLDIDIVYRFKATADPFQALSAPQAYTAIRNRTALVYPEALDITDAVLEELDVQ